MGVERIMTEIKITDEMLVSYVDGEADAVDNLLKNAPHTAAEATTDDWSHPYSRSRAVYPRPFVRNQKFWPAVGRIDDAHGDRNLFCSCPPSEHYEDG